MQLTMSRRCPGIVLVPLAFAFGLALTACNDVMGSEQELVASLVVGGQPNLSGTWNLNEEASDQRPVRRRRDGGGGGDSQSGGGRRGQRRRGSGDGSGGLRGGNTLVITQDASTVTFGAGDRSRTLYTDGRVITREGERGSLELRAFWQDDALVVERTFDNGRRITQTYALSEDGKQLYVTIRIEGDRLSQPVEFRRVYDAA